MRGIDYFLEVLAEHGVRYLFGNPGTTELPLVDALAVHPRIRYILGLQEVPVMGMADGYALASGQLGVVNLHISCGVGNAMGQLYNAYRENSPLLVTAGQQDRRLMFEEPILWGNLVDVVRPWTKEAVEVHRIDDLPRALRRAIQAALTPPTGPVFLSLPMDLQLEAIDQAVEAPHLPDTRIRPPAAAIRAAAERMARAKNPAIWAGSRVPERAAVEELVQVAELLGATVFSEPISHHGRQGFPCDHDLSAHSLPLWAPDIRQRLAPYDVLFVVGMDLYRQYVYYGSMDVVPEQCAIVHLDEDPRQLGKNYPCQVALWGDTRTGLAELAAQLSATMSDEQRRQADERRTLRARQQAQERDELLKQITAEAEQRPLTPLQLMYSVAQSLPADVAVVEAAVTTTQSVLQRLGAIKNTSGCFGQRGWTLGWGLNATIGVKLAWPDRPVLGLIGDGEAMYGIQGLWTAARYGIPVTWLICNNAQYKILKDGALGLNLPQAQQQQFVGLDLTAPRIDFVALANSLGVAAVRLQHPDEIIAALRDSWTSNRPLLIDVPIA